MKMIRLLQSQARLLAAVSIGIILLSGNTAWPQVVELVQDNPTIKVDFAKAVDQLRRDWESGAVKSIEIFHISPEAEFIGNVSSSKLLAHHQYRLTIIDPKYTSSGKQIFKESVADDAAWSGVVADVRWGVMFVSKTNTALFYLSFDREGRNGVVNGACVRFRSLGLKRVLEKALGGVFR